MRRVMVPLPRLGPIHRSAAEGWTSPATRGAPKLSSMSVAVSFAVGPGRPLPGWMRIALMIIGAQKAGTTSLGHYLGEHPALVESHLMEFTWFTDRWHGGTTSKRSWSGSTPQRESRTGRRCAKLSNLYMFDDAIARLREHNPRCQVVMVVRDPVIRAYSAYTMACSDGWTQHRPDFFRDLLGKAPDDELHRLFLGMGTMPSVWPPSGRCSARSGPCLPVRGPGT